MKSPNVLLDTTTSFFLSPPKNNILTNSFDKLLAAFNNNSPSLLLSLSPTPSLDSSVSSLESSLEESLNIQSFDNHNESSPSSSSSLLNDHRDYSTIDAATKSSLVSIRLPLHFIEEEVLEVENDTKKDNDESIVMKENIKKVVSFSQEDNLVTVEPTMPLCDYTKDELQATWYSPREDEQILSGIIKEAHMFERGMTLKGRKFCSRGLDMHTKKGSAALNKLVNDAAFAVLNEQDRQIENEINDPEHLAMVYKLYSSDAQKRARAIARSDAAYVRQVVVMAGNTTK